MQIIDRTPPELKELAPYNPQQEKFFAYFLIPQSQTFQDLPASALLAGYTKEDALNFFAQDWFYKGLREKRKITLADQAEKNIEDILSLNPAVQGFDKFGKPTHKYIEPKLLSIKADMSKFVAERLLKDWYSTRTEEQKTNINFNIFKILDSIERGATIDVTPKLNGTA